MQRTYTIKNLHIGKRGAMQADLVENGVIIANLKRGSPTQHFIGEFSIKFLSSASRERFNDFCDCISMEECCEALGFNDFTS